MILKRYKYYWLPSIFLFIYLIFISWNLYLFNRSTIIEYSDSFDYHLVAQEPITSLKFWAGNRTLTTPLIFKMLRQDKYTFVESYRLVPYFYTALSIFSWSIFVLALMLTLRQIWLKLTVLAFVLLLQSSKMLLFWNWVLLSESLFISLSILLIAISLLIIRYFGNSQTISPKNQLLIGIGMAIILSFWSFTRDTNALILIGLSLLILLLFIWKYKKVKYKLFMVCSALFIFALATSQMMTAQIGKRWQYPFVDVLGQRILPNQSYTDYFIEKGLPTNEKTTRFKNELANSFDGDWSSFSDWLESKARPTYLKFLLSHPRYTFLSPLREWKEQIDGDWSIYGQETVKNHWQNQLTNWVWYKGTYATVVGIVGLILTITAIISRRFNKYSLFSLTILLLVFPGILATWHGDARELARHSVGNGLQFRIALLLIIAYCADSLITPKQKS